VRPPPTPMSRIGRPRASAADRQQCGPLPRVAPDVKHHSRSAVGELPDDRRRRPHRIVHPSWRDGPAACTVTARHPRRHNARSERAWVADHLGVDRLDARHYVAGREVFDVSAPRPAEAREVRRRVEHLAHRPAERRLVPRGHQQAGLTVGHHVHDAAGRRRRAPLARPPWPRERRSGRGRPGGGHHTNRALRIRSTTSPWASSGSRRAPRGRSSGTGPTRPASTSSGASGSAA